MDLSYVLSLDSTSPSYSGCRNSCMTSHNALGGAVEQAMCPTPQGCSCKLRKERAIVGLKGNAECKRVIQLHGGSCVIQRFVSLRVWTSAAF